MALCYVCKLFVRSALVSLFQLKTVVRRAVIQLALALIVYGLMLVIACCNNLKTMIRPSLWFNCRSGVEISIDITVIFIFAFIEMDRRNQTVKDEKNKG